MCVIPKVVIIASDGSFISACAKTFVRGIRRWDSICENILFYIHESYASMLRDDHRSLNCLNNLKVLVGAGSGSTVVLGDAASRLHAVGSTKAAVLGHTIVGTIEA